MHIAMVSEHASPLAEPGGPDAGGQNVHVRELARALVAAGHRVRVHTRRDSPDLPDVVDLDGVEVHHVTAGPARPIPKDRLVAHVPQLAEGLQRAWRADPPDLVHAHFWMSGLAASAAVRGLDVPLVQTFHALGHVKRRHQGEQDTSPDGRTPAEQVITRRADRVIATCEDEVFELLRLGGSRRHISIVPCGVDTDTFTPHGPVLARGDRPRLVTVGRLVPRKGVEDVLAALPRVPDVELLVGGGPPPGGDPATDPDMVRLRRAAVAAGVADRVRFLGAVPRDDMPALLRSADAVVCAPWYEPFGMVPLEAMACGSAVVGTAVGGIRDTVVDGVTGLLVPPRRPGSLALALRELLADPTARESYGIAGRDRVMARYSWDRIATATEAVYRDVLAGRHRSVDHGVDHRVDHSVEHEPDMAGAAADGGER